MARNGYRSVFIFNTIVRQLLLHFQLFCNSFPGEALMRLPVFSEAIRKCDAALKPHGVDIINIITNKDKKTFDNILNSFVGIAAIQVTFII